MPIESRWIAFFPANEPAATLLIVATVTKLSLWPSLQANRVIREIKRLELQIARTK